MCLAGFNKHSVYLVLFLLGCKGKSNQERYVAINSLDLKRGEVVSCGPQDGELFGAVSFTVSIPNDLKKDFNTAIALLHSFEYDEAEKMFAKIIDRSPDCAMAYWGVAMSNFHPLWAPPTPVELEKGSKAIAVAKSISQKTKRESAYIDAMGKFYEQLDRRDHRTRMLDFEKAMQKIYLDYPDDLEAAVFYALALDAAADPADKTYSNQRRAFAILAPIFDKEPLHPGVAHYLIHNCDYPGLAELGLPAARKYAAIAPASAHAQHMPSHIFTRLGRWDECIRSNLASVASAKCYAERARIQGHWDEELHGIDYLVYAYLQKGEDELAKEQVDYVETITEVYPVNFKTAYAFAAIRARYLLERKMWKEAANLSLYPADFPWEKFPWQEAIVHYARLLGAIHTDSLKNADQELHTLNLLYNRLASQTDKKPEAAQVAVQIKSGEGLIEYKKRNKESGLQLLNEAADMEDGMEKHPVTPGEVVPARELLAEMLLAADKPALALENFELDLKTHPNRFNALYGAALAAGRAGEKDKAFAHFNRLIETSDRTNSKRPQLLEARSFILHH